MKTSLFRFKEASWITRINLIVLMFLFSILNVHAQTDIARWTYEPLQGVTATPTPNTGSGSSLIVGSMTGAGTGTGMSGTGCGSQVSGTSAWAIGTANPGTVNESSGVRYNVSTVGYEDISVTWDQRFSNTATNTVRLQYTTDGTTWANFVMTSGNTTVCNGSINANGQFEAANASGDLFRRVTVDMSSVTTIDNNASFGIRMVAAHFQSTGQFRQTSSNTTVATAGTWRFDNVAVRGTSTVTPTINGSATAAAFTTTYGTTSASQSFSVSGSNLTANITATAPAGFEVSSDNTSFSSTATFTQSGGSASGTLYIRLATTAAVGGSYNSQNIVLSSTGATSVNITTASIGNSVSPAALTITGVTAQSKIYDGNTTATLSGTPAYNGLVNGESFSVTGTPVALFADANVNTGIAVAVTGYTAPSANYTVSQPAGLTADISAKSLTISGLTADNKVYDGNTTATLSGTPTLVGVITADIPNVTLGGTYTATFADPNIANNIVVTVTGYTISGSASGNYALQQPTGLTANITSAPLQNQTITFNPLTPVTYGDADFSLTATASSGLPVSYISSNTSVATVSGSTVTIVAPGTTVITASQAGDASYNPATPANQTLTVNQKNLTVTGASGVNKVYDATTVASISGATLSGIVGSDVVNVSGGGSFSDANTGTAKTITAALTLSGAQSSYYTLTQPTGLTADIAPLNLTISGLTANNKVFDGNTTATLSGTATLNGVLAADAGNVTVSGTPVATFASSAIGNGIAVTVTGYSLSGSASGNYAVSQPSGLTANITAAPTVLAAGDIAVIGYTTTGAAVDNFAILVLKDLTSGTTFYINDNEVASAGGTSFTDLAEGEASFVVKSGQMIPAGTVIVLPWGSSAVSTTVYDYSSTSSFGLGNNNEEIYLYTASSITSTTPSAFIYYAKIGTSPSAIPAGLTLGTTAIAPNGGSLRYVTTGALYNSCVPNLLAAIGNTATNWNTTGATILAAGDWTFTVLPTCPDTPPTIVMDVATTSNYIDGGVTTSPASPYAFSGVISDPTDPASILGFDFTIGDAETAVGSLSVSVTSSNTTVVPTVNAVLTGTGASRHLTITPAAVGYSNISVNVNDGTSTTSYVVAYAASAAAVNPAITRFHVGRSDASTAVMIDNDYMLVADDENQALRLYNRNNSGLSINAFDFTTSLGLTDISGGIPREVDIESSVKSGSRIYWLGSHDNSSSGANRPNRSRIFATDITGSGASTTLTYAGRFDDLKSQLLTWDQTNAHGLGSDYFGLVASAATGVLPEAADGSGFNIEGLTLAPDNTTGYICFRAPISPASSRTNALIVPVTNFTSLFSGNPTSATANFGAPIMLNLGGRGIREIKKNASNQYLILAGPVNSATDIAPSNFVLYSWTGNSSDVPVALTTSLSSADLKGSFEGIVDIANPMQNGDIVQLVVDNGDNDYYGDAIIAKDLANGNHKKATSINITLSGLVSAPVINSSLTTAVSAGASLNYTITATNSPVSYNATSLPSGLNVSTSTGAITGSVAVPGVYNINISASNIAGTDSKVLVLSVTTTYYADVDGDSYGDPSSFIVSTAGTPPSGYVANQLDCNDAAATINPAATEVCDLIDNDCDGLTDEGVMLTYYADADGDGYGNAAVTQQSCYPGFGFVLDNSDCNDANAAVNPAATEVCNGIDDDCDNDIDADDSDIPAQSWYPDADGDTYGDASATATLSGCPVAGMVTNYLDCDDGAAAINPAAAEICDQLDNDCDGLTDEGVLLTYYADADGDGYGNAAVTQQSCYPGFGYVLDNSDCNDANAAVNPAATEVCNGIDDDCDNDIDADDSDIPAQSWYPDADGDTYGDASATATLSGCPVAGMVTNYLDCDDGAAAINPAAAEMCDLIDNDCDGLTDEGVLLTYYADADGDSYGNAAVTQQSCYPGFGYVLDNSDCNDANAAVNPTATEVCNGIDDDCDNDIDADDSDIPAQSWYPDADGDTYGDASATATLSGCPVAGMVTNNLDCDDGAAAINPAAAEVCDLIDNDCDGLTDEGVMLTYYADADGDGYGNAALTQQSCYPGFGFVLDNSDCDDMNTSVNPAAVEICNGIDDDCDNNIDANDPDVPVLSWYPDLDGDMYGDASAAATLSGCPVSGMVNDHTDCDDTQASVYPGATEICDGLDNDCNGSTDDGLTFSVWYVDADNDGYGSVSLGLLCYQPAGSVAQGGDCDDATNTINPGMIEICNGIDDNCNGSTDEGVLNTYYADADTDGYGNIAVTTQSCTAPFGFVSNSSDCNDGNSAVNPAATEVCANLIDDDCDGQTDEGCNNYTYYADADNDGYGNPASSIQSSSPTAPAGYSSNNLDCNDAVSSINPAATELCNNIDDDCDGVADDGLTPVNASINAVGGQFSFCPGNSVTLISSPSGSGITQTWSNGNVTNANIVNTVGSYSVTITNASGCTGTATVNVALRYRASDFNHDGVTDVQDFLSMVAIFNQPCTGCQQDINHNGVVNVEDFLLFITEFGLNCQ